jgi:DNA-directed RNA polymerase subunit H (RpoH/RPB5)
MSIIPGWRSAWRLLSVQVGALAVIWIALPSETQSAVLNILHIDKSYLPGIVGVAVIVARLIAQPGVSK